MLRTRLAIRNTGWNEVEELIWIKPASVPLGHVNRPRRSWESILWFFNSRRGHPSAERTAMQNDGADHGSDTRHRLGERSCGRRPQSSCIAGPSSCQNTAGLVICRAVPVRVPRAASLSGTTLGLLVLVLVSLISRRWIDTCDHSKPQTSSCRRPATAWDSNRRARTVAVSCGAHLSGQFPVIKGIGGASMCLQPGCLRELHWHSTANWYRTEDELVA